MSKITRSILLLNALLIVALWPVWEWWSLRAVGEYAPTLICLSVLLLLLLRNKRRFPKLALPSALLIAFALIYNPDAPSLSALFLVVAAVSAILSSAFLNKRFSFPVACMLCLSMPVSSLLGYFLASPIQLVSDALVLLFPSDAQLSALSLLATGITVPFNAPCNGVRMLWQALFFISVLGVAKNFKLVPFLILVVSAFATVLLANVSRAALSCFDSHLMPGKTWTPELFGMVMFVAGLFLVCRAASVMSRSSNQNELYQCRRPRWLAFCRPRKFGLSPVLIGIKVSLFAMLCLGCALLPISARIKNRTLVAKNPSDE